MFGSLGQVSVQRVILTVKQYKSKYSESVAAYIEESVVRRELSDNYCYYNKKYDQISGIYKTEAFCTTAIPFFVFQLILIYSSPTKAKKFIIIICFLTKTFIMFSVFALTKIISWSIVCLICPSVAATFCF